MPSHENSAPPCLARRKMKCFIWKRKDPMLVCDVAWLAKAFYPARAKKELSLKGQCPGLLCPCHLPETHDRSKCHQKGKSRLPHVTNKAPQMVPCHWAFWDGLLYARNHSKYFIYILSINIHLNSKESLWDRCHFYVHFMDKETELLVLAYIPLCYLNTL